MITGFILSVYYSIVSLIESLGYLGIYLGMTVESSFIPFPSEVILIPAGTAAYTGSLSVFWIFIVGLLGSLTGALINYYLAFYLGRKLTEKLVDKYGKFFLFNEKTLLKTEKFFKQHGAITTFTGRLIPAVRQLISLPAGFAKMNIHKFLLYTSLGAGIWTAILIAIGYSVGQNISFIEENLNLILIFVSIIIILIYILINKWVSSKK